MDKFTAPISDPKNPAFAVDYAPPRPGRWNPILGRRYAFWSKDTPPAVAIAAFEKWFGKKPDHAELHYNHLWVGPIPEQFDRQLDAEQEKQLDTQGE